MPNINHIISSHNKSVLKHSEPKDNNPENACNCRANRQCPLDKKCLTSGVIYQATVTRQDTMKEETYIGLTENTFKSRYSGHSSSFNNANKRNATALSEHVWTLKDSNIPFTTKWKIMSKAKAYSTSRKLCNLCIEEKYFIIYKPELCTLNKRNELLNTCRHRKKYELGEFDVS